MKKTIITKLLFIFVSICFIATLYNCTKKEDQLPYAFINRTFSINDAAYFDLQSVGGSALIKNEGINGIIVYRRSIEEIVAFDGNCTYEPADRCAVHISEFSNEATDSCCGSVFQLFNGIPIKGPATRALYEYNVFFNGENFTITTN